MLKLFNIKDEQVALFKQNRWKQTFYLFYSFFWLCASLIFALPGNLISFPLSTAISFYAEQERIKALRASNVKVKANDVLSSVKILAYISSYPIYYLLFTFVLRLFLRHYFYMSREEANANTSWFMVLYPIFSIVAIRSHDGVVTHYTEF